MNTLYETLNSVYEYDEENKRLRRVRGVNKPTPNTGQDGVWRDVAYVERFSDYLLIEWAEGGLTRTSRITSITAFHGEPA